MSKVKQMIFIFTFCLLQPRPGDQSQCTTVSHSKSQFLAEKNLRSAREVCIYTVIYKPF